MIKNLKIYVIQRRKHGCPEKSPQEKKLPGKLGFMTGRAGRSALDPELKLYLLTGTLNIID